MVGFVKLIYVLAIASYFTLAEGLRRSSSNSLKKREGATWEETEGDSLEEKGPKNRQSSGKTKNQLKKLPGATWEEIGGSSLEEELFPNFQPFNIPRARGRQSYGKSKKQKSRASSKNLEDGYRRLTKINTGRECALFRKKYSHLKGQNRLPKCKRDGSYAPRQCAKGLCHCVDSVGNQIGDSWSAAEKGSRTCKCAQEKADDQRQLGGLIGRWIRNCDSYGSYVPRQCFGAGCFCVQEDGTRTGHSFDIWQKEENC